MQSEPDSNDSEYQELVRNWLIMCKVGVSVANCAVTAWLQLCSASMALHTSQPRCDDAARVATQSAFVHMVSKSEHYCKEMLRISPLAFESLVTILRSREILRNYSRVTIEEQLITFLLIVGHNMKNRAVSCFLCRSGETISRYFHNIMQAIITLEDEYVVPANSKQVQPIILNSPRFFPFFKDYLGAIDGTHVCVKVSQVDAPRYRGRKEWPTQNVLAACKFDLKFTYVLAGWEGSAFDSRVLQSALTRDEPLLIPEGKFYLGDAGFGLTSKILTPYGRTRYHLKEYSQRPPETPAELFNHRQASLRNVIERAFDILKKRFPIIASGSECQYSVKVMTNIILACFVLHNFILTFQYEEEDYTTEDSVLHHPEVAEGSEASSLVNTSDCTDKYSRGRRLRDSIASEMWSSYCHERNGTAQHMATPNRGKSVSLEVVERSPKKFRWSQPFEDCLLDLLLREQRKCNRPDSTFTATAFRNVVTDFNSLNGTTIMKKHVLSRIKTMKSHFVMFYGAFKGLSGFSWNPESKMFEAEISVWDQRIQVHVSQVYAFVSHFAVLRQHITCNLLVSIFSHVILVEYNFWKESYFLYPCSCAVSARLQQMHKNHYVLSTMSQENPKLQKFREKACHNWDKLLELYGDTRARGDEASDLRDVSNNFKRSIEFDALCMDPDRNNCGPFQNIDSSSYGDDAFSIDDVPHPGTPEEGSSLKSGGTSKSKQKRKLSLVAVMEEGYKSMAASVRELSLALVDSGEKVAGAKFDVSQNTAILTALSELGLEDAFRARCYLYLSANPGKTAAVVAAPLELRSELLKDIMPYL